MRCSERYPDGWGVQITAENRSEVKDSLILYGIKIGDETLTISSYPFSIDSYYGMGRCNLTGSNMIGGFCEIITFEKFRELMSACLNDNKDEYEMY